MTTATNKVTYDTNNITQDFYGKSATRDILVNGVKVGILNAEYDDGNFIVGSKFKGNFICDYVVRLGDWNNIPTILVRAKAFITAKMEAHSILFEMNE